MKDFHKTSWTKAVIVLSLVSVLFGAGMAMAADLSPMEMAGMVSGLGLGVGMAVANTKSTAITNDDASPKVLNQPYIDSAVIKEKVGTVETAAADDDGSVYRLVRVRSSCRITSLLVANDAITAGTAFEMGVYQTALNGGAVVDADIFASAVDLSSALGWTEYINEATATDKDKVEKRLWELLGLTVDPQRDYDICLTGTTVGSAAGTISMKVRFVD